MGNGQDFTSDPQLMKSHSASQVDVHKTKTLFDVEDISFPLSTSGMMIVDSKNRRVKLAGGNWSGAHMIRHCVDGL